MKSKKSEKCNDSNNSPLYVNCSQNYCKGLDSFLKPVEPRPSEAKQGAFEIHLAKQDILL